MGIDYDDPENDHTPSRVVRINGTISSEVMAGWEIGTPRGPLEDVCRPTMDPRFEPRCPYVPGTAYFLYGDGRGDR